MRASCVLPTPGQPNSVEADPPLPSGAYFFGAAGPICAGKRFTNSARAVYIALAWAYNVADGCARISNGTIAARTGLSVRTVKRATKALEAAGVIRASMSRDVRACRGRPRGERRRASVQWSVNRGGGHGRPPRRGGYTIMAKAAVAQGDLHRNAWAVLAAVGAEVDRRGWAEVSAVDLAADCGISERTARHWLRVLVDGGYLTVDRRPGRASRYRLANPGKSVSPTPATGVTPTRPSTKPIPLSQLVAARATPVRRTDAWQGRGRLRSYSGEVGCLVARALCPDPGGGRR